MNQHKNQTKQNSSGLLQISSWFLSTCILVKHGNKFTPTKQRCYSSETETRSRKLRILASAASAVSVLSTKRQLHSSVLDSNAMRSTDPSALAHCQSP